MQLGRFDPAAQAAMARDAAASESAANGITAGSRCEVRVASAMPKRGTVRFVGALDGKAGMFVGVQYDEPLGKHDGTLNGKR